MKIKERKEAAPSCVSHFLNLTIKPILILSLYLNFLFWRMRMEERIETNKQMTITQTHNEI